MPFRLDVLRRLLNFQYEWMGYGRLRCRSCGSFAYEDEGVTTSREECSETCPWRQAEEILKESV